MSSWCIDFSTVLTHVATSGRPSRDHIRLALSNANGQSVSEALGYDTLIFPIYALHRNFYQSNKIFANKYSLWYALGIDEPVYVGYKQDNPNPNNRRVGEYIKYCTQNRANPVAPDPIVINYKRKDFD